ncbi:MarR family transcriptional regulator [Pseudomonas sp. RIT-PI-S]|uniref:MarR family winged helix-turn-helix transcriptional regulator n=1 Tax=Pseudomonas sp. RIT-PI-S TaxID=3035295 RepID=UPI0021D9D28B|nr:MarR family transcriptional regulator [Pseudomonas sp. RIT-PI-S]
MSGTHDRRYIFLLNVAQRRIQRQIERRAEAQLKISAVQAGALFAMARQDGALSGDLAAALDIAPSAMTGLADRLIKAGLVMRQADAQDKRINRLWLTAAGRETASKAMTELATLNDGLTEGFSDEEMGVVSRWLEAMAKRF